MTLSRMFEQLNRFRTADLLRVIRREEDIPRFEKLFNDYQLGRLWDHLPAVLFFYAVFAVASGVGRLLASWLLRERLAKMDAKAQYKVKVSWAHHVVAFTNALLTSCMTVCEIYRAWNRPLAVGTHEYYPQVARLLSIGVGYFIWDVLICFKHYSLYGASFALHAVMAFVALLISFRPYMMNMVPYYMLVEISTVFLHANWFLIKMGLEGSWVQIICHGLLILSYLIIRIIIAPFIVRETLRQTMDPQNTVPVLCKIIFAGNVVALALLSQYWFWKLSYKTLNKIVSKKKSD